MNVFAEQVDSVPTAYLQCALVRDTPGTVHVYVRRTLPTKGRVFNALIKVKCSAVVCACLEAEKDTAAVEWLYYNRHESVM